MLERLIFYPRGHRVPYFFPGWACPGLIFYRLWRGVLYPRICRINNDSKSPTIAIVGDLRCYGVSRAEAKATLPRFSGNAPQGT